MHDSSLLNQNACFMYLLILILPCDSQNLCPLAVVIHINQKQNPLFGFSILTFKNKIQAILYIY